MGKVCLAVLPCFLRVSDRGGHVTVNSAETPRQSLYSYELTRIQLLATFKS